MTIPATMPNTPAELFSAGGLKIRDYAACHYDAMQQVADSARAAAIAYEQRALRLRQAARNV